MAVNPDAEPPRTIFMAESSILFAWPITIPRKPMMRMKPPRAVRGVEWPGMWYFFLFASNRPIRGPTKMHAKSKI